MVVAAVSAPGCATSVGPAWSMPRPAVTALSFENSADLGAVDWQRAAFGPTLAGPLARRGAQATAADERWETRARFLWTFHHLLVQVESIGPAPDSPFEQQDDLLHQADVIELFLDVTGRQQRVIEIQVNPQNVTTDYLHYWSLRPTYTADAIDEDFYRQHHRADLAWDLQGLVTRSTVQPIDDGDTRWTVEMAVPVGEALANEGHPAELHAGQTLYVNVMRYARPVEGGQRALHQYNLAPVQGGRPHQSPMGVAPLTLSD